MRSPYLLVEEAAAYCRMKLSTFRDHRFKGDGPPVAARAGRRLLFRREDLDAWLESRGDRERVAS